MTDHKYTDDEIIELLNAYVERKCGKCNVKDLGICCGTCFITAISQAADLINRQKCEIESLQAVHADMIESLRLAAEANKDMQARIERLEELAAEKQNLTEQWQNKVGELLAEKQIIEAEAIKEFAERFKAKQATHFCKCGRTFVYTDLFNGEIDTLVKEMTEGHDESQNT